MARQKRDGYEHEEEGGRIVLEKGGDGVVRCVMMEGDWRIKDIVSSRRVMILEWRRLMRERRKMRDEHTGE